MSSYLQSETEEVTNLVQQVSNEAQKFIVDNFLFPEGEDDCMNVISDDHEINAS